MPTKARAWAALLVADAIADGAPYPRPPWWTSRRIARSDRISAAAWAARVADGYTRQYMHGVTVALAWLLGQSSDPRLMAPLFDGSANRICAADREAYQARLGAVVLSPGAS